MSRLALDMTKENICLARLAPNGEDRAGARDYNFWVYIMSNKHRTVLYIDMTDNLIRRVGEHRAGEIPGFTASYRCKELVYYEYCTDVLDAIAREKQLKRWSRSKKATLIATLNPHWRDLAPETLGEEQAVPSLSFRAQSRNL